MATAPLPLSGPVITAEPPPDIRDGFVLRYSGGIAGAEGKVTINGPFLEALVNGRARSRLLTLEEQDALQALTKDLPGTVIQRPFPGGDLFTYTVLIRGHEGCTSIDWTSQPVLGPLVAYVFELVGSGKPDPTVPPPPKRDCMLPRPLVGAANPR